MKSKIEMNSHAEESATIYAEALIEACIEAKVKDPKRALTDADEFPRLLKIPEVEYAIGWLNGCAEAHGVLVGVLWDQVTAVKVELESTNTVNIKEGKTAKRAGGAR